MHSQDLQKLFLFVFYLFFSFIIHHCNCYMARSTTKVKVMMLFFLELLLTPVILYTHAVLLNVSLNQIENLM